MAVSRLPDGRWFCYWQDPETKKQVRKYFGRGVEAEAKARQYNQQMSFRVGRPPRKNYGPTFSDLAKLYYRKKGFDRKPRETLSYRLDGAILPILGHRYAMAITANHMEDYVDQRRLDGVKDNSIHREITDIKAILNWSTRRQPPLIPINPVRDFKPPSGQDENIQPPAPDEMDAIYKNAASHLRRFILLAGYIGARPGAVEVLSLTWESVRFASRTILVISAKKGGPPRRDVPIHDDLLQILEDWKQADVDRYGKKAQKMTIVNYWGRRVTTIKSAWRSALTGAKITRRIRPYDLRHRFVTLALESGVDIGVLSGIVGSRPETLRKHYQHVTAAMHHNAVHQIKGLDIKIMTKKPQ